MNTLTLGFAGTPAFGLAALEALYHSPHHLKAVYTQPDRPAGRGRKLQASPIKQFAMTHDLPVFQPLNFKQDDDVAIMQALELDVLVVIAYGLILPVQVLNTPRYGCINVHASLLPRWRGASPIQQSILHGDKETGVTLMQMDKGMDTGDILSMRRLLLEATETTHTLHDKLAQLAIEPLLETIDAIAHQQLRPVAQSSAEATYAPKITKEEAHLRWNTKTEVIDRQIRAYQPWPITYTFFEDEAIRIHGAQIHMRATHAPPGTIVECNKTGVYVATQDGLIQITSLQSPGGKVLAVHEWLQAHPSLNVGMHFE